MASCEDLKPGAFAERVLVCSAGSVYFGASQQGAMDLTTHLWAATRRNP
jgi:hypothetical protein